MGGGGRNVLPADVVAWTRCTASTDARHGCICSRDIPGLSSWITCARGWFGVDAMVHCTAQRAPCGPVVHALHLGFQDPIGGSQGPDAPWQRTVRPWKRLVAFTRVQVDAGTAVPVALPLLWDDLAFYGDDMVLRLHPGVYTLSAGQSSVDDTHLTVPLVVNATVVSPPRGARATGRRRV
jgi:hypothetical protein